MSWKFSKRSYANMVGVRPELVAVASRALLLSPVDFGITEGLRTRERQEQLVAAGASWTMDSRHLTGHALDVVAYVRGEVRWDWPLYTQIANAWRGAALDLKIPIIWGGAWQRILNDFSNAETAQEDYVTERRRQGRRPTLDGPHFELDRSVYP